MSTILLKRMVSNQYFWRHLNQSRNPGSIPFKKHEAKCSTAPCWVQVTFTWTTESKSKHNFIRFPISNRWSETGVVAWPYVAPYRATLQWAGRNASTYSEAERNANYMLDSQSVHISPSSWLSPPLVKSRYTLQRFLWILLMDNAIPPWMGCIPPPLNNLRAQIHLLLTKLD